MYDPEAPLHTFPSDRPLEQWVQIGMRAVIADVQEWLVCRGRTVQADDLRAYLLALLVTAGAYDDGQG
jgi:hypothetical protein